MIDLKQGDCLELMKDIPDTDENEIVLDNCMGSGTTAIACINTNRNFIGFEMDKQYFDIANKRINEHHIQTNIS